MISHQTRSLQRRNNSSFALKDYVAGCLQQEKKKKVFLSCHSFPCFIFSCLNASHRVKTQKFSFCFVETMLFAVSLSRGGGGNCSCKPPNVTSFYDFYCFHLGEVHSNSFDDQKLPQSSTEICHSHYQTIERRTQEIKAQSNYSYLPVGVRFCLTAFFFFLFFLFLPLIYIRYLFKEVFFFFALLRTFIALHCAQIAYSFTLNMFFFFFS